jgi:hypothetical protein
MIFNHSPVMTAASPFTRFSAILLAALGPTLTHAAPNLIDAIARPLRYHPDGGSFVVENGQEVFNRPLYGLNTAFRVDAGDRPEFSLYLPGRGGNLRLGLKTPAGAKWLVDADHIFARYGEGVMRYEIRDRLLGGGTIRLTVAAMDATEGLLVHVEMTDAASACELICAYGGVNGERGARNGDVGTEREPVARFFQLKAAYCAGNQFEVGAATPGFRLHSKPAEMAGVMPEDAPFAVANAEKWSSIDDLLASPDPEAKLPVVVGRIRLEPTQARYLALQRLPQPAQSQSSNAAPADDNAPAMAGEVKSALSYLLPAYSSADLPRVFDEAQQHWRRLSQQVTVETPDPFINAAAPALCVAADGIWDARQKAFMHGAVAWRTRLLGWRGGYTGDALGWHGRTRDHLMNWLPKQNADPLPASTAGEPGAAPPDESVRLTRNEPALHSNGDLSRSHYDMNLPAIDVLFRHLLWTGDLDFARQCWPVIERHLAWERRLFRRPFGADKLPLYEAYCCIWASDDLQYHGGGVTHSSAYNFYHNKMAAAVAKLIGQDAAPYEREADLILKAMRRELWLPDRGWYAEWKDLLGLQLTHPNAALWTFYHAIDSEVAAPMEAWQMSRFVDTQISHIPIKGESVPTGDYYTLPTTSWMPYVWSTNNVVMAESAHTALAYWQAGRGDEAFRLYKGLLLDSMFMGACPGNVGMCTQFDMARGETQRDFADGVGTASRALVEGLFGLKPNALVGELTVQPGFPADWDHAAMRHPDVSFAFQRKELSEHYRLESRFPKPMKLRLIVPALRDNIAGVRVNGQPAPWRALEDSVGVPRVEIQAAAAAKYDVVIVWTGEKPFADADATAVDGGGQVRVEFGAAAKVGFSDPQNIFPSLDAQGNPLQAAVAGTPGIRTFFTKLRQGGMTWWMPGSVKIMGKTASDYPMMDWSKAPLAQGKLECVDLAAALNDRVTQIFKNEYRSPRSPYCSLAIPTQGIGSWVHWNPAADKSANAEIDDAGLRAAADKAGGRFMLPQGIPFQTPGAGDAKNIAFVSQWDNYPREIEVPLTGKSSHLYLLMAGSTNSMQSRFDNGEVLVTYADGSRERLALENPTTWWPIQEDYLIDDYAFRRPEPIPLRVDLKTGRVRQLDAAAFKGKGGKINGGSATILDMALRPEKELKSLTVRALANEVVIGLMSATLARD